MTENTPILTDVKETITLCKELLQTNHYKKMGGEGIFAIVQKAKALGIHPLKALNGGMYFVQGKVEMSAAMMNELIRMKKHSITKDRKSDDTVCILHGKRVDNNDTWTESFSIDEAKRAGIYRNQWLKYPRDMLFARALSRLARQLFPDVIQGCYVQGEIFDAVTVDEETQIEVQPSRIKEEQLTQFLEAVDGDDEFQGNLLNYLVQEHEITSFEEMTPEVFEKIMKRVSKRHQLLSGEEMQQVIGE